MVWTIHTPTPNEGAALTGLTQDEWQTQFAEAYIRQSYLMLDALGVDTSQLPCPTAGWASALQQALIAFSD